MIHSVISHELHGLLYIMSAQLIYLILTPIYVYKEQKRKVLFVLILLVFTYFYLGYEDLDPIPYTLHLAPVSLSLAILFEGSIPGIFTWLAFNIGSHVVLHNELWPTLLGSSVMLAIGLFLKKKTDHSSYWFNFLYASGIMAAYVAAYLACKPEILINQYEPALFTIAGAYFSTWFVTYLFFHVKKQEINKEKLVHAEKDRMVGQLAASVSHEIRNPLTTTRGVLQMLEKREYSEEDRKRYIGLAISGVDQANDIITDYLHYAKRSSEQTEHLDIKHELAAVLRFMSPMAIENGIHIEIKHDSEDPCYIIAETRKFKQCLLNLIKNAIESMNDRGILTIETRKLRDMVEIIISDTGVGMNKTLLKSLGLPFHTTKEHGTGLGLVVVMSFIKTMNGTISFSSKVNQGTTCSIQFKCNS